MHGCGLPLPERNRQLVLDMLGESTAPPLLPFMAGPVNTPREREPVDGWTMDRLFDYRRSAFPLRAWTTACTQRSRPGPQSAIMFMWARRRPRSRLRARRMWLLFMSSSRVITIQWPFFLLISSI
jgi:hypothetical protein